MKPAGLLKWWPSHRSYPFDFIEISFETPQVEPHLCTIFVTLPGHRSFLANFCDLMRYSSTDYSGRMPQNEKRDEDAAAQLDKEVVPPSEANKPVFSASSLLLTPVRMAEDIRKAISELFSSQRLVLSAVSGPVSDDIAVGKIWEKIVGISSSLFPDLPDTA